MGTIARKSASEPNALDRVSRQLRLDLPQREILAKAPQASISAVAEFLDSFNSVRFFESSDKLGIRFYSGKSWEAARARAIDAVEKMSRADRVMEKYHDIFDYSRKYKMLEAVKATVQEADRQSEKIDSVSALAVVNRAVTFMAHDVVARRIRSQRLFGVGKNSRWVAEAISWSAGADAAMEASIAFAKALQGVGAYKETAWKPWAVLKTGAVPLGYFNDRLIVFCRSKSKATAEILRVRR